MHCMQWWEVLRYCNGLHHHTGAIQQMIRWHGWVVARMLGSKSDNPQELYPFRWEKEVLSPEEQQAEQQRLHDLINELKRKNESRK